MTRKEQYGRYLGSREWREKRDLALARSSGFCQFCGDFAEHVHHVRYPKQFGHEDPNSLIAVCDRCHKTSHGIQKMKALTNVVRMRDFAPTGRKFNYLVSEARVFASAESWISALQMPESMRNWFTTSLHGYSLVRSRPGQSLEMMYEGKLVYRWHAVAEALRAFDRQHYAGAFKDRPTNARREIDRFHDNYEKLVAWGYDLQERALAAALNQKKESPDAPITQGALLALVKEILAPRFRGYDDKLEEHDVVIEGIKKAVPVLRDQNAFISIKQAITEQGYSQSELPLYPQTRENLSNLAGRMLADRKAEKGEGVLDRLDGVATPKLVNTYRRSAIYAVLDEIMNRRPQALPFGGTAA